MESVMLSDCLFLDYLIIRPNITCVVGVSLLRDTYCIDTTWPNDPISEKLTVTKHCYVYTILTYMLYHQ